MGNCIETLRRLLDNAETYANIKDTEGFVTVMEQIEWRAKVWADDFSKKRKGMYNGTAREEG